MNASNPHQDRNGDTPDPEFDEPIQPPPIAPEVTGAPDTAHHETTAPEMDQRLGAEKPPKDAAEQVPSETNPLPPRSMEAAQQIPPEPAEDEGT